jgi:hypothetical protein
MHTQRIIILAFSLIGIVSSFLPWFTTASLLGEIPVNGTDVDGWITLILFLVCIILSLFSNIKNPLIGHFFLVVLISSILAGIIAGANIYKYSNYQDNIFGVLIKEFVEVEIGIGIYLIISSSILIPLTLFFHKK